MGSCFWRLRDPCLGRAPASNRLSLLAFVISFVPAGTLWLEGRLRRDERKLERQAA